MPVDHLLVAEAEALPAIVVVRLPSGLTHFVVVWRVHGGWVQVMDPARGRRWVRGASFLRDVYTHSLSIAADAFREWAGSEGFTGPLERRLKALGIDDGHALVARALTDPGWASIAGLDRAARAIEELAAAGAVSRGAEARRLVDALATADGAGAKAHATATAAPPAADGSEQVTMRGAVLLRVAGASALDEARRAALPVELRAAVDEPRVRVGVAVWRLLREAGVRWRVLAAGVALSALGTVVEAVLFRALFDAAGRPMFAVVVALLASLLALELPLAWGLRRAGAAIEERFRDLFMRKIPRLGDRYFQSRPVSDMAERAHLVHKLRALADAGRRHRAHRAGDRHRRGGAGLAGSGRRSARARARGGDARDSVPGAARGRRTRSAHAQSFRRARALLPRRPAGPGDRADARRRARAGARAPGSAARVGPRRTRLVRARRRGGNDAGAGRFWPRRLAAARFFARTGAHEPAPGCWPSTGQ